MPPRKTKKPATAKDLDALLNALKCSVDAPQKAVTGKAKKRKRNKASSALQAALPHENDIDTIACKLAPGSKTRRTSRRALQTSELTTRAASVRRRQKLTPKKQKLKSSARHPTAKAAAHEEEDGDNQGNGADSNDDSGDEQSSDQVAVARKRKTTTVAENIEGGARSPSTDDTGGEDFILVMKKMTVERQKRRERDAKKIDTFFSERMQKHANVAEQRIHAIAAQASEATRLYRTNEMTTIQKKINAETKAVKDLSKSIPSVTEETLTKVQQQAHSFVRARNDALTLAVAESKSRKQKLQSSITKIKANSQAEAKTRAAREKLLANALATLLKCAE